jgi:hypothetical protein
MKTMTTPTSTTKNNKRQAHLVKAQQVLWWGPLQGVLVTPQESAASVKPGCLLAWGWRAQALLQQQQQQQQEPQRQSTKGGV